MLTSDRQGSSLSDSVSLATLGDFGWTRAVLEKVLSR